ncbi:NADH-quinone oxidoreductase subunit NuoK [Mitsuokella sp. AF21-1AC]|uniref:NADH-quinone oxidoreductase subunit NuoK n=1 Tax=Mitsuokella sp. AF21-1AC TaxID=2292235 RepID=UPI000E467CEC|nr:NADH-quinone oxidoreductase subunit NuoK [Mitsuokella sp. AF21-1AC]RGS72794.1 NADH-quinone oxidoreductase subunit NuoK [Mitsuokella sp. AF21-1AC]
MSTLNASIGMNEVLTLSAFLFSIGLYGLFTRRGIIAILMCIELMLNAVNLNLIAFDRLYVHDGAGQVMALFSIAVAAAEIAVGLALAINLFRLRAATNADEADGLHEPNGFRN